MALTKIKGQNFRAFVAGSAVVEAVNCSVQITGNMEDNSTKDTESDYTSEQMVSKSWQVQVDSYDATAASIKALLTRFNTGAAVSVAFDQTETTAGSQNRTAAEADFARSGQALLTDLSIQANNRATINISTTYQGTGALATPET